MDQEFHRIKRMPPYVFAEVNKLKAEAAVSPGVGFGEHGEGFVRLALVENEHRIRQAVGNVKAMPRAEPVIEDVAAPGRMAS